MDWVNDDIKERAIAYKSEGFYINDKNILMCRHCNCQLEWRKKENLTKHLQSNSHKKKISKSATNNTRQSTITRIIDRRNEKSTFIKKPSQCTWKHTAGEIKSSCGEGIFSGVCAGIYWIALCWLFTENICSNMWNRNKEGDFRKSIKQTNRNSGRWIVRQVRTLCICRII